MLNGMNTTLLCRRLARGAGLGGLLVAVLVSALALSAPSLADDKAKASDVKRVALGKNVFAEVQDKKVKRIVVNAVVVLREGQLEGLLTIKNTKEHEYILGAEVDARNIHAGLLLCGAKPGTPVRFDGDKYIPASGPPIKITLRYDKDGKKVTVPAKEWITDGKTKKPLAQDWVFGGSRFVKNDEAGKPDKYMANFGDVVCLCNMELAMLDLPVRSPTGLNDRIFSARTDVIPPKDTKVEVIFELAEKKKDK
jgi:hypothetical protein